MSARRGFTLWLTGLSGAGKSTLAQAVSEALAARGHRVEILDGDEIRENLSKGLSFSKEDRDTNVRRIGYVARLLSRNGVVAITAAISPYREVRDEVRREHDAPFVEVFVDCSIDELTRRDRKGLYARALKGEIEHLTGVSDPYEPPVAADVTVHSDRESESESLQKIMAYLEQRGLSAPWDKTAARAGRAVEAVVRAAGRAVAKAWRAAKTVWLAAKADEVARATEVQANRWWSVGLGLVLVVFLHNTLPYLTMMPRVNVDEPWLMERAYQVWHSGIPSQPMLGLQRPYLLQVGFGYLYAPWFGLFGVGLLQARLLGVVLGLFVVMMVASIGRRTIDQVTGLSAALFLALDSNFLGGVRNARTDIPSVFFATTALAAYLVARQRARTGWFVVSGASLGLAMLCHGNAFWVAVILLAWYLIDYGRRAPILPFGYGFFGGLLLTLGPYLAIVSNRWSDVQDQIGNFAGDRVPSLSPAFVLQQIAREPERYRFWYFGLVTNLVPNPLLLAFQMATAVGVVALAVRSIHARRRPLADPGGAVRLLVLVAGSVFIFAAFINNKVPVYLPHLLLGFSLAAGFGVSEAVTRLGRSRMAAAAVLVLFAGYGAAGVAYYERWYRSVNKSELVPYEATEATLRALVPHGPKYVYGSPQFWTPFHAEEATTFYSYAAAQPMPAPSGMTLAGAGDDRPIYLVMDEAQWLPELASTPANVWQRGWIQFIERRCALEAVALGTAHGTIALYRCALDGPAPTAPASVRFVGGTEDYVVGDRVFAQTADELSRWQRNDDPRRTSSSRPEVGLSEGGLRISGTGWPGIMTTFRADPGARYLVRIVARTTRDGDLLYLGRWQQAQVRSLAGASSAGILVPFVRETWFPHERAFMATVPQVRMAIYSEAAATNFLISSLEVFRLAPRAASSSRR